MKNRIVCAVVCALALVFAAACAAEENGFLPNGTITDNLESAEDVKTYLLELPEPGGLRLRFEYVTGADYDVEILRPKDDGTLKSLQKTNFDYDRDTVSGTIAEQTDKLRLPEGTYYVRVSAYNYSGYRNDDYSLTALYDAEPGEEYEKEHNNVARKAMAIAGNAGVTGNLASAEDVDFYRVTMPGPGTFQAIFTFASTGDYDLEVFRVDESGELSRIQYTNMCFSGNTQTGSLTRLADKLRLPAGEYYLSVKAYNYVGYRNDDYVLCAYVEDESGLPAEREFNGKGAAATGIDLNTSVAGNLSSAEDADFYRFTIGQQQNARVRFTYVPRGDYDVTVYEAKADGTLSKIQYTNFCTSREAVTDTITGSADGMTLGAGTYYIKVNAYNYAGYANADYTLAVVTD